MNIHLLRDCVSGRQARRPMSGLSFKQSSQIIAEDEHDERRRANPTPELTTYGGIKLGWIQGVLIPCLLNIWGVMLFLRISWVVAQAGIVLTVLIICLSGLVCVITTLSLSAICTNGRVQGGGVYYLVSRSLGAEMGASVGIIFAFANAVAASMNTIGFCESLNELLKSHDLKIVDNDVNDIRIVGAIALLGMCLICAVGMDWETKAQNFLIVTIVAAIVTYILGACIGPLNDYQRAQGFAGISMYTATENLWPDYRLDGNKYTNFFTVFAMYFPAVTGVQAGANICGDLKNPASAIPKGTLVALMISVTSYLVMAVLCGVAALRDASGNVSDVSAGTLDSCRPNCFYGLHNNYSIMHVMALSSAMIYAGCWAATLSTALTNLLSVPRLIQALGVDRIYPGLIFFSKPYGRHGEPYRGYVLTFFVSMLFLFIADLNTIAPLITNFYLASYALINFCTFHASIIQHISWRPSFSYYNTWVSLVGCLLCIAIMLIISWLMALVTMLLFISLYLLVLYRHLDVNWGSSTEAQRYKDMVAGLVQMTHVPESIKSYNPQLLVLAGRPYTRPALLDVAHLITRVGSFMIVADINVTSLSNTERLGRCRIGEDWLRLHKTRGFYLLLDGLEFEEGVRALMQSAGLGRLTPNILLLGFKEKWMTVTGDVLKSYVHVIQDAFEHQLAVALLRVPSILNLKQRKLPKAMPDEVRSSNLRLQELIRAIMYADSNFDLDDNSSEVLEENEITDTIHVENDSRKKAYIPLIASKSIDFTKRTLVSSDAKVQTVPREKVLSFTNATDCLDAWCLYDDGGLNILLSYVIARRGVKINFRIFALAKTEHRIQDAEKRMRDLLDNFRIDYSCVTMVQGINDRPSEESLQLFDTLIQKFKDDTANGGYITQTELNAQYRKTHRHLRLRELMLQHSSEASMIVMSLPMPRKGLVSAALYMAWLEVLSRDLPPVLFVRGNDTLVLST